ncbi:hypothetical protein ABIB40_001611 [Pedobacter sp. UYP30]|uniref:DUF2683 family protein n=1 Tax=Pedobacter sp. UYP30 TaxID=1756400 RepID=UPI003392CAFC
MGALTFLPKNEEQLVALKAFAKAFKVPFKSEAMDKTAYLSITAANTRALDESIKQIENGQTIKIALEDLWK